MEKAAKSTDFAAFCHISRPAAEIPMNGGGPMIITELRRQRRSLYRMMLDGCDGPLVDVRTFDDSPYCAGGAISDEELAALLALSEKNRARDKALYLLGLRDYGCRELERKLTLEYAQPVAHSTVQRLCEQGLIRDDAYAARLAQRLSRDRHYSRRRIRQELLRRGIDRELAVAATENLEDEDFEQALALIEKSYYNKMNDRDSRQKVMAALARRGFGYGAVRQAMAAFDEAQEDGFDGEDDPYEPDDPTEA